MNIHEFLKKRVGYVDLENDSVSSMVLVNSLTQGMLDESQTVEMAFYQMSGILATHLVDMKETLAPLPDCGDTKAYKQAVEKLCTIEQKRVQRIAEIIKIFEHENYDSIKGFFYMLNTALSGDVAYQIQRLQLPAIPKQ